MRVKYIKHARIRIIFSCIFITFTILLIRIIFLLNNERYIHSVSKEDRVLRRVDIVDRNNEILATNLITYTLYAEPSIVRNPDAILKNITKIYPNINQESLKQKLSNNSYKGRVLLIRDLTPKQKYEINNLGHVGLFFHEDHKRFYPHKNIVSHIIGFVDREERGLAGFEKYIDDHNSYKNNLGDNTVSLSIDINVQTVLHQELSKAVKKFSANGGAAIVMDANNFEVYGMVSLPDYNPYYPQEILHNKEFNNKATYNLYEMGSTFKTFTFALALENKLLTMNDKFDVSENIKIDKYRIKDFKKIDKEITTSEVFTKSSNIGTAQIAQNFSKELQQSFFHQLRFFEPLDIELIERSHSKLSNRWGKSKIITASYGYGISVTAMHLVQATAAMINGGTLLQATLIKGQNEQRVGEKIISKEVSDLIREFFYETVEHGTGWRANLRGYNVGGKTGSANKIGKNGYDESRLLSSFISAFPMNNPKYIVFVLLDEPHGIKETYGYATGGVTSAPVVRNIIEKIAPILNVTPNKHDFDYKEN